MIQSVGNKEYITVSPTDSKDVLDRITNAARIMESKSFKVICARCSKRLFINIAKRFAPQLGFVEQKQLLIGGNKPEGEDVGSGVLLEPNKNIIYNSRKPFALIIMQGDKQGVVMPEYD